MRAQIASEATAWAGDRVCVPGASEWAGVGARGWASVGNMGDGGGLYAFDMIYGSIDISTYTSKVRNVDIIRIHGSFDTRYDIS